MATKKKEEPKYYTAEWVERVDGQYHKYSVNCVKEGKNFVDKATGENIPSYASITPAKW